MEWQRQRRRLVEREQDNEDDRREEEDEHEPDVDVEYRDSAPECHLDPLESLHARQAEVGEPEHGEQQERDRTAERLVAELDELV